MDDQKNSDDIETVDTVEGKNTEAQEDAGEKPTPGKTKFAPRPPRRRSYRNAADLMTEGLVERAEFANPRLRTHLAGKIVVSLNNGDSYIFDWNGDKAVVTKGAASGADCTIKLHETDLMKIASGDLNPQIGMLSDKINISGKVEQAIYFFNLIAPGN